MPKENPDSLLMRGTLSTAPEEAPREATHMMIITQGVSTPSRKPQERMGAKASPKDPPTLATIRVPSRSSAPALISLPKKSMEKTMHSVMQKRIYLLFSL